MAQKESVCGPENRLMNGLLGRGGGSGEEEQRTAIEGASSETDHCPSSSS